MKFSFRADVKPFRVDLFDLEFGNFFFSLSWSEGWQLEFGEGGGGNQRGKGRWRGLGQKKNIFLLSYQKRSCFLGTLVVDWPLFLMLYKNKKTVRLVASSQSSISCSLYFSFISTHGAFFFGLVKSFRLLFLLLMTKH